MSAQRSPIHDRVFAALKADGRNVWNERYEVPALLLELAGAEDRLCAAEAALRESAEIRERMRAAFAESSSEREKRLEAALASALECARVRGEALKPFADMLAMEIDCDCDHGGQERTITTGDAEHSDTFELRDADGTLTVGVLRAAASALALQPGDPALAEVVAAREERLKAAEAYMLRLAAGRPDQAEHTAWLAAKAREDAARRKRNGDQL